MLSNGDMVLDERFGQLIVNVRTLGRSGALFDRDARRMLAAELYLAAFRLHPKGRRRFVRSEKYDRDGSALFRLIAV